MPPMNATMGLPDGGADVGVDPELILGEVQVLLSEKRTSLAIIRNGIAVMALPLSIVSVLIATSRLYDVSHVLHLLIPVLVLCGAPRGLCSSSFSASAPSSVPEYSPPSPLATPSAPAPRANRGVASTLAIISLLEVVSVVYLVLVVLSARST